MATALERFQQLNLSEEETEKYRRRFKAFDLDKDGVVSAREFSAVSKVFGYKFSREEILTMFGKTDLEESGAITFEEFVVGMKNRAGTMKREGEEFGKYRDAFCMYDTKQDGYITAEGATPILYYELGFDENKTERLVETYDKNKDYRLSLPEFIPFYQRVLHLKALLDDAFNEFDKNKDGFIGLVELNEVLTKRGFAQEDIVRILQKYDKDGDRKLDYQEFAVFWNLPV